MKTPNTKDQTPKKRHAPSSNPVHVGPGTVTVFEFGVWCLVFGCCLVFGVWCLEL
jgi:hypothetical protein